MILLTLSLSALFAVEPAHQFDFWLGDWDLEISTRTDPNKEDWTMSTGKNHVERILDAKVICENFDGAGLVGKSWSLYDPSAKVWRQTWVDNQSSYIALTGKWEGDKMVLLTIPGPASERPHRMEFLNIKSSGFSWEWQVQKKDGAWATMFRCIYARRGKQGG